MLISREELRKAQNEDELCREVSDWLARQGAASTRNGKQFDALFRRQDGILLRCIPAADDDHNDSPFKAVMHRKLRKYFLIYFHDSGLGGHSSGCKVFHK